MTNPSNYGSNITGTLSTTTAIVPVNNLAIPSVITFTTAAGTIQLSVDGGVNYYPAVTPTGSIAATQVYYILSYPVTHIKFNGAVNDKYVIVN